MHTRLVPDKHENQWLHNLLNCASYYLLNFVLATLFQYVYVLALVINFLFFIFLIFKPFCILC